MPHPKKKVLHIADLFCGAGGTSTGAAAAAERLGYEVKLTCVNHWDTAIETHRINHPEARHLCTSVDDVDPYTLYKPGQLYMLLASPECTEHSYAKGGRAVNDQRRVTAWCVVRWAEALLPPVILVENVVQFVKWGPIDSKGKPIKRRKGEIFKAWKAALMSLGYKVDERRLRCDRYGVPTSRERLIVQAVRGRRQIIWPQETHAPLTEVQQLRAKQDLLSLHIKPVVPAREIIDWTLESRWLHEMPQKARYGGLPLAPNTIRRIHAGFLEHGMKPFVVPHFGERPTQKPRSHSLDEPLPTVTSHGAGSLVTPYVVSIDHTGGNGSCTLPIDAPLSTITSKARHCVLQPYVVRMRGTSDAQIESSGQDLDEPLKALTAGGTHDALVQPFLIRMRGGDKVEGASYSMEDSVPTVTGSNVMALLHPFIIPQLSGGAPRSVDEPLPTVTSTSRGIAFVQPYIVKFYGTSTAASIDDPLDTVTGKDRFALVCPKVDLSDGTTGRVLFQFRMVQPHELQLAQGFPRSYKFTGNKSEVVKQIGNAVPPGLADAVVSARLRAEGRAA